MAKKRNWVHVAAYLPKDLYEKVKKEAKENQRTISGQVIFIIKKYFKEKS